MSAISVAVKHMLAAGMTPDQVVAAIAEMEDTASPARSAGAARQARYRRRKAAEGVTSDVTVTQSDAPSPTPLTQIPTPFSPPKGGQFPPPFSDIDTLAETIWSLQPSVGGKRKATKPDVRLALVAALKRKGSPADIEAACRAYYRLPDCTKDEGKYAKGAAVLLTADRWREFLPTPKAQPPPATPERLAQRVRRYAETGEWFPAWGPEPSPQTRAKETA